MVQEARLDLGILRVLAAGLVLLATPALAQDGPLTTLMRPQPLSGPAPLGRGNRLAGPDRLFGDNPLASVDSLTGEGSLSNPRPAASARADATKPGEAAAACDPRAAVRPPPPGAASSGSGPGEYARFVESGGKPPAAAAGERPLYGGTDRPLWDDAKPGAPGQARSGATRAAPLAPASGSDRPLWADSGAMRDPGTDRCDTDPGTRRAGMAAPPSSTLFFGSEPAR